MVTKKAETASPILTDDDLIALLQPGEVCILASATPASVVQALGAALAPKRSSCFLTVGSGSLDETSRERIGIPQQHIALSRSATANAGPMRKSILSAGAGSYFLIDISSAAALSGIQILSDVLPTLRRRKTRSWWIVPHSWFEAKTAGLLRKRSDYLAAAAVGPDGSLTVHFVSAREIVEPAFFLPRQMKSTRGDRQEAAKPVRSPVEVLVDAIPGGVLVYSPEGKLELANRYAVDSLGFPEAALRERPLTSFVASGSLVPLLRFVSALRHLGSAYGSIVVIDSNRRRRRMVLQGRLLEDGRALCHFTTKEETDSAELDEMKYLADTWSLVLDSRVVAQALFRGSKLVTQSRGMTEILDWMGVRRGDTIDWKGLFGSRAAEIRKMVAPSGDTPVTTETTLHHTEGDERTFEVTLSQIGSGRQALVHVGFCDVTRRAKTIAKLEESESFARTVAAATETCLVVLDDGSCEYANRAALDLLGIGIMNEIQGKNFLDLCLPRYRATVRDAITMPKGDVRSEIRLTRKGGSSVPVDVVFRSLDTAKGTRIACVFHDAGPSRKLKADLRRAHRRQELLDPFIRTVAGTLDPGTVAQEGLHEILKNLGLDGGGILLLGGGEPRLVAREGISEKAAFALSSQIQGEGVLGYLEKTLETVVTSIGEYPPFLPLKALWEEHEATVIVYAPLHSRGKLLGVLAAIGKHEEIDEDWPWLFSEIGAHMGTALASASAFHTLGVAEQQYRSLAEWLPDIAYRCRATGAVEWMGPRVESLFGHRTDDFSRNPEFWRSLVHPDDRSKYSERISRQQGNVRHLELYYRMLPRGKAVYKWVRDSLLYDRDAEGQVNSIVGVLTVVEKPLGAEGASGGEGEARPLNEEVKALREALSAKAAEADEFASVVSHDLKEPLITIEAYSKIVREEAGGVMSAEAQSYLERVVQASGRLKSLIDDLLTLSRIGRGARGRGLVAMNGVMQEIRQEIDLTLQLGQARLVFPAELPRVSYDRTELTMVFRNLVSNGLKFNRNPEPCVEISVEEGKAFVTVAVRDNGIGIASGDQGQVFVMFRRLNSAADFPGTGAGLTIVKRIVERHGGRIWLESTEGEGSTFFFTIPREGGRHG